MQPQFVVVEGLDGVGSTTASKLLVQWLTSHGREALWTKQPSDGTIGRHIRRILKHEERAHEMSMFPLFLADRHDHVDNVIQPELEQGNWVVCDRYVPSTWVYQQDNYDPLLIEQMHRGCLAPDWIFILHAPVEICQQRIAKREGLVERYEVPERQEEYAKRYRMYGPDLPRIGHERIIHIDTADLTPEQIVAEMVDRMRLG